MLCPQCGQDIDRLRRGLSNFWHVNRNHCLMGLARHVGECEIGTAELDKLIMLLLQAAQERRLALSRN